MSDHGIPELVQRVVSFDFNFNSSLRSGAVGSCYLDDESDVSIPAGCIWYSNTLPKNEPSIFKVLTSRQEFFNCIGNFTRE